MPKPCCSARITPSMLRFAAGTVAAAACLPGTLASAQTNAVSAMSSLSQTMGAQSDLVLGNNSCGPFCLSWKQFREGSDLVMRDGTALKRDQDYALDVKTGMLTFSEPLRQGQVARITYRTDNAEASLNKNDAVLPIQMDMWQSGSNRLSLRTVYHAAADSSGGGAAATESAQTALQFVSATNLWAGSVVNSGIYLDMRGGDWFSHSGFQFGQKTKFNRGALDFGYARAGALFSQDNVKGLKVGSEVISASGSVSPFSGITFTGSAKQTTDLPGPDKATDGRGAVRREVMEAVNAALPGMQGALQMARAVTDTTQPNGQNETRTQDKFSLDGHIEAHTTMGLTFESSDTHTKADGSTSASYTQKSTASVTTTPSDRLRIVAKYQNELSGGTARDTMNVNVEAQPFAGANAMKVKMGWTDRYAPEGADRRRTTMVEMPVMKPGHLTVAGGFQETSTKGQQQTTGLVSAAVKPLRMLEISAEAHLRDGSPVQTASTDYADTLKLHVALSPCKILKLTGSIENNPDNDDGSNLRHAQQRGFGVETQWGGLKLHGQFKSEDAFDQLSQADSVEIGLDWKLSKNAQLTGAFRGASTASLLNAPLSATRAYEISFTHKIDQAVEFSIKGAMTVFDEDGTTRWDRTDVKAGANFSVHF